MSSPANIVSYKATSWVRWPILVLACFMLVGSYYSSDIPAALKQQLDDYFGDPKEFETYFSLLYTLYSMPNIILPFFGGYFVDRLGFGSFLYSWFSFILLLFVLCQVWSKAVPPNLYIPDRSRTNHILNWDIIQGMDDCLCRSTGVWVRS